MNLYRFNKQNKVRGVSMTIGIGVWAFLVYILAILVWMLVVKRNIADAYVACLCAGAWTFGYRLLRVWLYARKYDVKPVPADQIKPLGQSFHDNWTSLLMLLGIAIPLLITIGPGAEALKAAASFGEAGVGAINIVLWVPIVVCLICFIVGRKNLPKNAGGWVDLLKSCHSSFCTVGGVLLFALAASNVLNAVGFDQDLALILQSLSLPGVLMVILTCIMIALVAGPLSAVATTAAVGQVAYSVLVDAGIAPICAVVAFMICISTEGASPPSSSPIFISCGLAEVKDPKVIFRPLITDYVLPPFGRGGFSGLRNSAGNPLIDWMRGVGAI